jgi:uncharacterized protein (TIGR04222 family)
MVNPFDLPGPQFLMFYLALLAGSGAVRLLFWRSLDQSAAPVRPMTEPYQISYLRGGAEETVKVAVAILAHRGWLSVEGEMIRNETSAAENVADPIEKAVLGACSSGATLSQILGSDASGVARQRYHQRLVDANLFLSNQQRAGARFLQVALMIGLLVVAVIKIAIALERGRRNVGFLIVLAAVGLIAHLVTGGMRTPNGSRALRDLKTLFARLRDEASGLTRRTRSKQFPFLVAVFGVGILSTGSYPFAKVFQSPSSSNAGCGGSSCSSSSGSSCGGGGSSCGGGGCGGCGS